MTLDDFIRLRENDWKRLEQLCRRTHIRSRRSVDEIRELGTLYRAVSSDLALARRDYPRDQATAHLNALLIRAHSLIYREDAKESQSILRYLTVTIPRAFRQAFVFMLTSFLLFMIPAVIGFWVTSTSPDQAHFFGLDDERRILSEHDTWTDIPEDSRPGASAFIIQNNIRIAILAFGGGVAFGLLTGHILIVNGLIFGGVFGLAAHYGMLQSLTEFVIGHGILELSVIMITGGAGLQMGWKLASAGRLSRFDSLRMAAQKSLPLVILAIMVLVIAGVIEGFFSPSKAPFWMHVAVGVGTGVILALYLGLSSQDGPENSVNT